MTKRRSSSTGVEQPINNPVAKFAHQFNKAQVFRDKRQYRRYAKHRGQEPFAVVLLETSAKGFCITIH